MPRHTEQVFNKKQALASACCASTYLAADSATATNVPALGAVIAAVFPNHGMRAAFGAFFARHRAGRRMADAWFNVRQLVCIEQILGRSSP